MIYYPHPRRAKFERVIETSARSLLWERGKEISEAFRIGDKIFTRHIWYSDEGKISILWLEPVPASPSEDVEPQGPRKVVGVLTEEPSRQMRSDTLKTVARNLEGLSGSISKLADEIVKEPPSGIAQVKEPFVTERKRDGVMIEGEIKEKIKVPRFHELEKRRLNEEAEMGYDREKIKEISLKKTLTETESLTNEVGKEIPSNKILQLMLPSMPSMKPVVEHTPMNLVLSDESQIIVERKSELGSSTKKVPKFVIKDEFLLAVKKLPTGPYDVTGIEPQSFDAISMNREWLKEKPVSKRKKILLRKKIEDPSFGREDELSLQFVKLPDRRPTSDELQQSSPVIIQRERSQRQTMIEPIEFTPIESTQEFHSPFISEELRKHRKVFCSGIEDMNRSQLPVEKLFIKYPLDVKARIQLIRSGTKTVITRTRLDKFTSGKWTPGLPGHEETIPNIIGETSRLGQPDDARELSLLEKGQSQSHNIGNNNRVDGHWTLCHRQTSLSAAQTIHLETMDKHQPSWLDPYPEV